MYSTLTRKVKKDPKSLEPKTPKAPAKKAPRKVKQPAAKKARMDVRPVFEVTEEQKEQFEAEFADFDFSEDTLEDEELVRHEEELQLIELQEEEDQVQEFLAQVKKMEADSVDAHAKDEGHPLQVSDRLFHRLFDMNKKYNIFFNF